MSDYKPMVTVVIPCYNYANVVGRAIESVKAQALSNFECFVVNDGSTDDSEQAIKDAIKDDRRFHYLSQPNSGVAEARNHGVFAGTGKYVCCLDADDRIDPRFLEACVTALEEDPTIGIAYTGLYYYTTDGEEGLSRWPEQYNYDRFLQGQNQIPTCNVARREAWVRLGGQRQRYCPLGAGEEDAEFWLRAGAYGFRGKKITDAGLFLYSMGAGNVAGNKQHRTTDWLGWHPWTKDGKHPFASAATPQRFSHPVRQYDQPFVSVVIPVGPGHERYVETALDSLEAQGYRGWEAIVVRDADTGNIEFDRTMRAYPYAKVLYTGGGKGAGYARNRGVEIARAPLLLYLDADDWLLPNALDIMLSSWNQNRAAIYSDYIGKAYIDKQSLVKFQHKLLAYDEKYGIATIHNQVKDFDCEKAKSQPMRDLYIWSLVSTMFPRIWHDEIGGFDEEMESWEDWDYWIRMAKSGKCFVRVPEPLIVYRFYSGSRRDGAIADGARMAREELIPYLQEKYQGIPNMACNCGKNKKVNPPAPAAPQGLPVSREEMMRPSTDSDFTLIEYNHPSMGQHRVIGGSTGINYQYRGRGDRFLVHKDDIAVQPSIFIPVEVERKVEMPDEAPPKAPVEREESKQPQEEMAPAPPPIPQVKTDESSPDLEGVPWVSSIIAQELNALGVYTRKELADIDFDTLVKIKNVGKSRAKKIQAYAREHLDG